MVSNLAIIRADIVSDLLVWIAARKRAESLARIVFIPEIRPEKVCYALILPCGIISMLIQNIMRNKQRVLCDRVESRGILYQLMARFLKDARPKSDAGDNRIQKSITYIRKHINENIKIETLVDIACISKDHFIRLFKKETGMTPVQYISQKKIEKAQLLLVTEEMPIKEIAFLLSYEDHSYFNRLFKKITGVSPQEYRRNHLKK